jgi:glycerophosphoryl diester phosphodiesterase
MTRPQIYAHRGFSHRFPENTLLAFEQAALAGADGVEFDIHLAADGVPVVVHDLPLGRTVKGTGLVPSWRSDQLAAMDAGTHKGAEFTGIGVPSLRDVFEWSRGNRLRMNVEIKAGPQAYAGLELAVVDLVREFALFDRVVVSAFDHYTLLRLRDLEPRIETAILVAGTLVRSWDYVAAIGARGIHFHAGCPILAEDIAELQRRGIALRVWTVNEPAHLQHFIAQKMDAIITDCPDRALQLCS